MEVGKSYFSSALHTKEIIYKCEAILSNGMVAVTYRGRHGESARAIHPSNFKYYEEYKEPRKGEFYVVIWKGTFGRDIHHFATSNLKNEIDGLKNNQYVEILSIKKIEWIEGEGLDG